jgi:hypothetical protein
VEQVNEAAQRINKNYVILNIFTMGEGEKYGSPGRKILLYK